MIVPVDETNLLQAATIHSISWKESHRAFCTPDFIETHTPDRQREYLRNKMNNGTKLYMLVEEKPIGVSVHWPTAYSNKGFNRGSLYSSRYAKHGLWNEIVTIRSRPMYGYPYAVDS